MRTTGMPISGRVRSTAIACLSPIDRSLSRSQATSASAVSKRLPATDWKSRAPLRLSHQRARLRIAAAKRRRIVVAGLDVLARADDVGRAHLGRFQDRAQERDLAFGMAGGADAEMTALARAVDDVALERRRRRRRS